MYLGCPPQYSIIKFAFLFHYTHPQYRVKLLFYSVQVNYYRAKDPTASYNPFQPQIEEILVLRNISFQGYGFIFENDDCYRLFLRVTLPAVPAVILKSSFNQPFISTAEDH